MKKFDYQEKYIKKLGDTAIELLEDIYQEEGSAIVFQAPTGAGKTYMISQALTQIVKRSKQSFSFIWISINTLHEQSRQNLMRYLENERLLDCITVDEIQNKAIEENEIVFFNWDSLIKENNVFRMDNENDWNLESLVANTKEDGRKIILIIDESHRTARAEKAQDVIKEIAPTLIIEITATPKDARGTLIKIPLAEVIDAGMIKSEVQINPGSHHIKENKDLLEVALKKRKQLKAMYEGLGAAINPLLLIQIPKRNAVSSNPEDYMIGLLAEHNITVSNKKLAIWFSERKENLDSIEDNDNNVDVLIFKEAIAVGWDCPRAVILYLQREWKQEQYVFNIQTLGRIMRMPEQHHYDKTPELNIGYVFSASDNFEVVRELAKDYVSTLQMERDEDLIKGKFSLHSEFIRRKRELTRLSGDFKKCLLKAAKELDIKDKINKDVKIIPKDFAVAGKTAAIDLEQQIQFEKKISIKKDIKEIAYSYANVFCAEMAAPYAKARSAEIVKSSIRSWFKENFDIGDEDKIALIVMHVNNNSKFKSLLEKAKDIYQQLPVRNEEVVLTADWQVPETISIFTDYEPIETAAKSIIKEPDDKKLYVKKNVNGKIDLSKPEIDFIKRLEQTDDELQWWFKNSHSESKYFGIAYKKRDNHYYAFYPDFILKTKKETLIVEIKDDKDFKPDNLLKYNAGKEYQNNSTKYPHKESLRFYIFSPDDYDSFFQLLQEQNLDKFNSLYEERLLKYSKSHQLLLNNKPEKSEKESMELELLDELDKTLNELKDTKLKNELLQMELEDAKENVVALSETLGKTNTEKEKTENIKIQTPFNICVLGEVSDEEKIIQDLQQYFVKQGIKTNEWDIKFFNNSKLQNADVLRSLVKGQSRYCLIIIGQIHHHSGKGNAKANIISELKNEKYIPHKVGSNPKDLLTPDKALKAVDEFLFNK